MLKSFTCGIGDNMGMDSARENTMKIVGDGTGSTWGFILRGRMMTAVLKGCGKVIAGIKTFAMVGKHWA